MTAREAAELVAALGAAYPRQQVPAASKGLYVQKLLAYPYPVGVAGVNMACSKHTWYPSWAELHSCIATVAIGAPDPHVAWEQACARGPRHPLVERAMHSIGGSWAIKVADNVPVLRAQYLKAYAEHCQAAQLELGSTGSWAQAAAIPPPPRQQAALPPAPRTADEEALGLLHTRSLLDGIRRATEPQEPAA